MHGHVKWFDPRLGYGFIIPQDRAGEVFVHYSSIQMDEYKTLEDGEEVEFEIETSGRGPQARNVVRLTPAPECYKDLVGERYTGNIAGNQGAHSYVAHERFGKVYIHRTILERLGIKMGQCVDYTLAWDAKNTRLVGIDVEIPTPSECPARYAEYVARPLTGYAQRRGACGWIVYILVPPYDGHWNEVIFFLSEEVATSLKLVHDQKVSFAGCWDGIGNQLFADEVMAACTPDEYCDAHDVPLRFDGSPRYEHGEWYLQCDALGRSFLVPGRRLLDKVIQDQEDNFSFIVVERDGQLIASDLKLDNSPR